jgi:Flp pilus assembly protein CpaB
LIGSFDGDRAMFIRMPKTSIGDANVHCRVDLYGISKDNNHKEPELLIKNLLILAVQQGKEGVEGGVTFAVKPESARAISRCQNTMDLSLKVRHRESEEIVKKFED